MVKAKRAKQEVSRETNGRWSKGHSGNPAGRKPGPSFLEVVRRLLEKGTTLEVIVKAYLDAAKDGGLKAIMDLADRLDGKPLPDSFKNVDLQQINASTGKLMAPLMKLVSVASTKNPGFRIPWLINSLSLKSCALLPALQPSS